MKLFTILVCFLGLLVAESAMGCDGYPKVDPKNDEFEVLLTLNDGGISCFPKPSLFYVILRNKTEEPKRLFEFWNSWGYQNISFYFYMEDGVHIVTVKDRDFTRNFPSTNEVPGGETMVFPITFDKWWDELPKIEEGKSKVKMQVVYKCNPSLDAKEAKAWTGIVASKVYEVTFWRAHASIQNRQAEQDGADKHATAPKSKPKGNEKPQPDSEVAPR